MPKSLDGNRSLRTPRDYINSMFSKYKPDTDKHLQQCFEYDFMLSKIDKMVKDVLTIREVKEVLLSNYKYIKDAYRKFAGDDMTDREPAIGPNLFANILRNCGNFVDGTFLKF